MKKTMKSEYMLFYQSCIISMEISFFIRFPFTGYCMCVCVFVSISLSIPSARCRSPPLQKKEIKMMPVDWICFFLSAFSKMQSSKRFVTLKLGIFMVRAEEQNIKKKRKERDEWWSVWQPIYAIFHECCSQISSEPKRKRERKGAEKYVLYKMQIICHWKMVHRRINIRSNTFHTRNATHTAYTQCDHTFRFQDNYL